MLAEDLDEHQQKKLLSLLKDFEDLFDGTLGKWNTDPIDIETKPNHKPSSARYYPVPKINKATFKKELVLIMDQIAFQHSSKPIPNMIVSIITTGSNSCCTAWTKTHS